MELFDVGSEVDVRRRGRKVVGLLGLLGLLLGPLVVVGATAAGAAGPGSVSGVSVSLSTNAVGATQVDYTVGFTTSATGALDPNTGTITLSTTGSTSFPSNCAYTVTDVTTSQSVTTCPTGSAGSSVTISAGVAVNANDSVKVVANQVANASATGSKTLTVSTSSDLAASTTYSLVAASPVSGVSASLSTNAVGATEVNYTVGFKASATGALDPNNGTITLSASGSTAFPSNCAYSVTDTTTSQEAQTCPTSDTGSSVTISAAITINAGDSVKIVVNQVGNASATGSKTLTVSTSSDLAASTTYSLVAASPVSGVSASLSTNAAGATEVNYTVGFKASATGALDPNNGTITLSASGSTAFPSNCAYSVTDTTTSQEAQTCPTSDTGSSVTISAAITINAGDSVKIVVNQVGNASATGSKTLTVSTSSDLAASTTFSLVAASPVTGVSVSLSTAAAGATEVDYTVGFTASPTGALDPNNGTITLSTSGTTAFPSNCAYLVTDVTTGQENQMCPTSDSGSTVIIPTVSIRHGDTVKVVAIAVANATATGSQSFTVSTSSDLAASTTFSLVAASPVTGVSVSLSTAAAGADEVDYTVGFTASTTGALDASGTITLSTSGATAFPSNCSYTVTDVSTGQSTTTCPTSVSGASVTLETGGTAIRSGDTVQVVAAEVGNAALTGSQTFTVSTSSDLSAGTTFSLVAASPVSGVSVKLSKTKALAKSKYTVAFTTSATGALDPNNGTITQAAPNGTVFPDNCSYTLTDVTTGQSTTTCPTVVPGASATISVGGLSIRAGDKVSVVSTQVKNAKTSGKKTLKVSTSSDLAGKGKYTLT